jgi:hypothetical protein
MTKPDAGSVWIEEGGKKFSGTYRVEHDVLELWTVGPDGNLIGPMALMLNGMPPETGACMLLREYVRGPLAKS